MIRTAIYARQSVTRDGSESLDIQIETCTQAASRLGCNITATLVEPPSTSGFKRRGRDRPRFLELLDLIRCGDVSAILVYKSERLSRGGGPGWAPVFDALEAAGIDPDHAVATPNGWMSEFEIGIRATMDREESKKLSSRMTDVRAREAKAGEPRQGGRRAFGYGTDRRTVVAQEADMIREAAARILAGETAWGVARDWNSRGVVSGSGGHWGSQTLKRVLKSGRVAGLREHHGRVVADAAWTPILDRDTWEQVRQIIDGHPGSGRPGAGGGRVRTFLLNGFVFCGRCGNRMHSRTRNGGRREYTCQSPESSGRASSCNGCVIHADPVEAFVLERIIVPAVANPAWGRFVSAASGGTDGGGNVAAGLAGLDRQAARIKDLYVTGDIDRAEFDDRMAHVAERRERLHRRIAGAAEAKLLASIPTDEDAMRLAWVARSIDWRRAVCGLFLERLAVQPGRAASPTDRLVPKLRAW